MINSVLEISSAALVANIPSSRSTPIRFHHPFLTARGRASMSGPHQFATLTRVEHDARPVPYGLSEGGNEPNRNERKFIMARTTTTASSELKTPAFQAWHVTNKGENSFWTKVGAASPHRDGKGLSLILSVIPISGQIVLRQPLPKTEDHRSDG